MSDFNALDLEDLDSLLDTSKSKDNEAVADVLELEATEVALNEAEQSTDEAVVAPASSGSSDKTSKQLVNEEQKTLPKKSPPPLKAAQSTAQWTEADMDAIKKMVIIFGSIISFLVTAVIVLSTVGLFSNSKADPSLATQIEEMQADITQSYLLLEDSGRQNKTMSGQLSDLATQLAEVSEMLDILQSKSLAPVVTVEANKQMSAAERKAALRAEIKNNLSIDREDSLVADVVMDENQAAPEQIIVTEKNASTEQIKTDLILVKQHLVATQKVLEGLFKQSEMLNQQSQSLSEMLKNIESDIKVLKPVKVSATKPTAIKKEEAAKLAESTANLTKPADDPEFRQRWSREMSKTDGFP